MNADAIVDSLLQVSPDLAILKKHRKPLDSAERSRVEASKAVWSDGAPGVWKSVINGKTWYVSNTHRAYQANKDLKTACKSFIEIVEPSS